MTVEFMYKLEEWVVISISQRDAVVTGLWLDRDKIKWVNVQYVLDNGYVCEDWFREEEVTKAP